MSNHRASENTERQFQLPSAPLRKKMPISVDLEYKLCPTTEPQRTQRGSFNNPLRLYGKKMPISVDLEYKLCPTT